MSTVRTNCIIICWRLFLDTSHTILFINHRSVQLSRIHTNNNWNTYQIISSTCTLNRANQFTNSHRSCHPSRTNFPCLGISNADVIESYTRLRIHIMISKNFPLKFICKSPLYACNGFKIRRINEVHIDKMIDKRLYILESGHWTC